MTTEVKKDTRPPVLVVATERGYDSHQVREVGETFFVPASIFDKRVRKTRDAVGVLHDEGEYDAPSWFEEAVTEEVTSTKVVTKKDAAKKDASDLG